MKDELIYECNLPSRIVNKLLFQERKKIFFTLIFSFIVFLISNIFLFWGIIKNSHMILIISVISVILSIVFMALLFFLAMHKGGPNRFFPCGNIKVFYKEINKELVLQFESFNDPYYKKTIHPNYIISKKDYLMICENKNNFVFLPSEFEPIFKKLTIGKKL